MDPLLILVLVVVGLVVFDLIVLRFGADSRSSGGDRPDWW